jgi:hypothetical protein
MWGGQGPYKDCRATDDDDDDDDFVFINHFRIYDQCFKTALTSNGWDIVH